MALLVPLSIHSVRQFLHRLSEGKMPNGNPELHKVEAGCSWLAGMEKPCVEARASVIRNRLKLRSLGNEAQLGVVAMPLIPGLGRLSQGHLFNYQPSSETLLQKVGLREAPPGQWFRTGDESVAPGWKKTIAAQGEDLRCGLSPGRKRHLPFGGGGPEEVVV